VIRTTALALKDGVWVNRSRDCRPEGADDAAMPQAEIVVVGRGGASGQSLAAKRGNREFKRGIEMMEQRTFVNTCEGRPVSTSGALAANGGRQITETRNGAGHHVI